MTFIPFSKLDGFLDLQGKFGRIKERLQSGESREQVLTWARGEIAKTVSLSSRWTLEDGGTATGAQFREAAVARCDMWADYLLAYTAHQNTRSCDTGHEQTRLKA